MRRGEVAASQRQLQPLSALTSEARLKQRFPPVSQLAGLVQLKRWDRMVPDHSRGGKCDPEKGRLITVDTKDE